MERGGNHRVNEASEAQSARFRCAGCILFWSEGGS